MNILYKYYSSKFALTDYLLNPNIRLCQTNSLNDPFEGRLTDEMIKIMTRVFISSGKIESLGNSEADYIEMKSIIESKVRTISISSLTETQRNILMWSHYASEHTGVCIGYKSNMIERKNTDVFSPCYSTTPVKVSYDSIVFDDESKINIEKGNEIDDVILNNIVRRAFTTKGDSWIYEKEHRIILPLEYCNQIILDPTSAMPSDAKKALNIMLESDWYYVKKHEKSDMISIFPSYARGRPMISKYTTCENYLSKYNGALFLKEIDKSDISSIYLGYKYPQDKEDLLIELISAPDNNLDHIDVYKMDLSNKRFDLISNPIYEGRTEVR